MRGITDTVIADAAYVESDTDITPDQYVEYAALRGDTSDNLPGVAGVGEKTAAKLINKYGSLEGIYSGGGSDPEAEGEPGRGPGAGVPQP
jgi:DNA polymerase I